MYKRRFVEFAILIMTVGVSLTVSAQERSDPAALIAAERQAMATLAVMDGVWRGPAWTILPSGQKHTITQTERIGPFLDGSIKVIEGRGYEPDGRVGFNAFAIVSYDPATKAYSLHSHAQGRVGDFVLKPTADRLRLGNPCWPNDYPLHCGHQERCVAGGERPHNARQGACALLRNESKASG